MPNSVFISGFYHALQLLFSKKVASYSAPTALLDAIQILSRIILDTCTLFSFTALYNPIPTFLSKNKIASISTMILTTCSTLVMLRL